MSDIDAMSMPERLQFLQAMESGPAAEFGASDRWHNIEGIVMFFRDRQWGASGTWVSYVDAGILEGVERGLAIALGRATDPFGNPGSQRWATYVTRLSRGELEIRGPHDRAWGEAEQASTDHGVDVAENHGQYASTVEQRFFAFSEVYRWALRNRPMVLDLLAIYGPLIHPDLARLRVPFYDWFTDVREWKPTYIGATIAYELAELHPIAGLTGMPALFFEYIPQLFEAYLATRVSQSAQ
ncbi:hypothetical protein LVJ94_08585 [Pendulispora rubella]|uniref:Uncharacterized protein n=1 Tax=Pendulispora rubella TaxID=2741070 RepID=A0ABZ2L941_9BACT